jgi:hypothetical protein
MLMNRIAAAVAVSAFCCGVIAALIPISRIKGQLRLAGSLLIGIAFCIGALSQGVAEHNLRLSVAGFLCGGFLVWLGLRKYRRDPEGRTRASQIL